MAAIFASFGVPSRTPSCDGCSSHAYYVLPLLVSLFFLHAMFETGRQVVNERS